MGPPSSSSSRRLACRAGARVESLLLCARTTGQNRFTTVKLKDHSRASFFPRGNEGKGKNIFTARVRARRKGRGEKLSENRKNGDDVHYRPVNSHSLTTHFLDRRRHFLFFFFLDEGGWNDRGERNFPFHSKFEEKEVLILLYSHSSIEFFHTDLKAIFRS